MTLPQLRATPLCGCYPAYNARWRGAHIREINRFAGEVLPLLSSSFSVEVKVNDGYARCPATRTAPEVANTRAVYRTSVGYVYTAHERCKAVFEWKQNNNITNKFVNDC